MKLRLLTYALLASAIFTLCGCQSNTTQQAPQVIVANELAAMNRLRAIAKAEAMYHIESGGRYATLDDLISKGLVNDPSRGKLTGYKFAVRLKGTGFEATAVPERFGISGRRSFYIDESGLMRAADKRGAEATSTDPAA
ncbi:MAG TPA: hypothetical protein VNO14_11360 [Blastocatellia bacterium]|nr:hypothetical protein [Blastocatellia bacterium]